MTAKLFAWDEISNMVGEFDPKELFSLDRDGGWETAGWLKGTDVRVVRTDRHTGLETWAESMEEAIAKFRNSKLFCECYTPEVL